MTITPKKAEIQVRSLEFAGASIRAVILPSGDVGFVARDVCDRLGYANSRDAIGKHCKGAVMRYPLRTPGGVQELRVITEPDVMRLIVSSRLPEAEKFESWVFEEVLPSLRQSGSYVSRPAAAPMPVMMVPPAVEALQLALLSAQMSADILMLGGSARLDIVHRAHRIAGADHLLPMLPAYSIDAPAGDTKGSSEPTESLSALLVKHGITIGALRANKLIAEAGLIEQKSRPSRKVEGGVKKFWSITDKGLAFGKNVTTPNQQLEVQVHWFPSRFDQVIKLARLTEELAQA